MQALQSVQYQYVPGQVPRAHGESVRYFVGAAKAYLERYFELAGPQLHLNPDQPSVETLRAFEGSKMVQNWLPLLGPEDQRWLISEMGFVDEYVPIEPVPTHERHCGWCGTTLQVVHGGRRALCMGCGKYSDVATPEIACTSCGAQVSIPAGSHQFNCPHCRGELHVHGAIGH